MIILGIDPGTAALGYGVVERTGGRLRAVDHGCVVTSPDSPLRERLLAIHDRAARAASRSTSRPSSAVERLFFSPERPDGDGRRPCSGVVLLAAAEAARPVREATPNEVKSAVAGYGAADKEQVSRMVQLVLGMPRPADARRRGRRARDRDLHRERRRPGRPSRAGRGGRARPAAVAPIARGESPYERAVREALAREGSVPQAPRGSNDSAAVSSDGAATDGLVDG